MARDPILVDHGTAAFTLPPSAVLSAAERDFASRGRKSGHLFAPNHLNPAKSVADLLQRAIDTRGDGQRSRDPNTRTVYGAPGLLEAALELALTREAR